MSTEGIARRRLIGTATAGTVGAGMATAPGAEAHRRRTRHVDMAVVGAGLAGHRGAGAGASAPVGAGAPVRPLFYVAAAGNEHTPGSFVRLISTAGGGQETTLRGRDSADRPPPGR